MISTPERIEVDVDDVARGDDFMVLCLDEGLVFDRGCDGNVRNGGLKLVDIIHDLVGIEAIPGQNLRPDACKVNNAFLCEVDESIELGSGGSRTVIHPGTGYCSHTKALGIPDGFHTIIARKGSNAIRRVGWRKITGWAYKFSSR